MIQYKTNLINNQLENKWTNPDQGVKILKSVRNTMELIYKKN